MIHWWNQIQFRMLIMLPHTLVPFQSFESSAMMLKKKDYTYGNLWPTKTIRINFEITAPEDLLFHLEYSKDFKKSFQQVFLTIWKKSSHRVNNREELIHLENSHSTCEDFSLSRVTSWNETKYSHQIMMNSDPNEPFCSAIRYNDNSKSRTSHHKYYFPSYSRLQELRSIC